jgi:hypothetical protein
MDCSDLTQDREGYGHMKRSCEYDNEPSGFTKCGEFVELYEDLLVSQEGFFSMESVV